MEPLPRYRSIASVSPTHLADELRLEVVVVVGAALARGLDRREVRLEHVVHVHLKAHDEDKGLSRTIQFSHQAHVDRDKVVRVILAAKARGHRSYARVDEARVREKAEKLPKQGVPPELLVLLPTDNMQDKLQMQKATT